MGLKRKNCVTGSATFVLHSHLPYCRLAGPLAAWRGVAARSDARMLSAADLRLPRLGERVAGSLGVTINMTPILAEQLGDPLMRRALPRIPRQPHRTSTRRHVRFAGKGLRGKTAHFHHDRYRATQAFYEDELHADVLAGLTALEAAATSRLRPRPRRTATCRCSNDEDAVRFQVQTGVASHIRNFGRAPRSFWLPECAYKPGIERFLEEAGIKVFFVETHLVTGGSARGKTLGGMLGPYPETERPVRKPASLERAQRHNLPPVPRGQLERLRLRAEREERPAGLVGEPWLSWRRGLPRVPQEGSRLRAALLARHRPGRRSRRQGGVRPRDRRESYSRRMPAISRISWTPSCTCSKAAPANPAPCSRRTTPSSSGTGGWRACSGSNATIRGLAADPNVQLITAADNIAQDPPTASDRPSRRLVGRGRRPSYVDERGDGVDVARDLPPAGPRQAATRRGHTQHETARARAAPAAILRLAVPHDDGPGARLRRSSASTATPRASMNSRTRSKAPAPAWLPSRLSTSGSTTRSREIDPLIYRPTGQQCKHGDECLHQSRACVPPAPAGRQLRVRVR